MGVPYSQEVKTAVDLASDLKSHATIAIYAIVVVSVIHTILLSIFLIAVLGLLITVNPDLAEERKAFVTPVLKWILLPIRGWQAVFGRSLETSARERRRGEGLESESRTSNESVRGQRRRKLFSNTAE
jgi:hypothetical protein